MSASIITTSRERKLGFRVLFLGMFAIGTGQTLFIAVLPPYARGLGLNTTEIGLIFSTKICESLTLNSEKFFPSNSLIVFSMFELFKLE